jgi:hypothetical protein
MRREKFFHKIFRQIAGLSPLLPGAQRPDAVILPFRSTIGMKDLGESLTGTCGVGGESGFLSAANPVRPVEAIRHLAGPLH